MKCALEITDLSKKYFSSSFDKEIYALNSINLKIEDGLIFGILGVNGAGKSTLINILSGQLSKSSGNIKIFGCDYDSISSKAKNTIGVVPQEISIDPFFTVREALNICGGYYGLINHKDRAEYLIKELSLSSKMDSPSRFLSGGMKRRLLIAKALMHDPKILLLDEPSAGVDIELRSSLWKFVKKLKSLGKTIILTTHYIEEAERLCDHVAIIDRGKVIISEKKETLLGLISKKQLLVKYSNPISNDLIVRMSEENLSIDFVDDNSIRISYDANVHKVGEIINKYLLGLSISDISTVSATLEDAFRYFTKKE